MKLLNTAIVAMLVAVAAMFAMFAAPTVDAAQAALAIVVAATLISYVLVRVDDVMWRREQARQRLKRIATQAYNNNYSKWS